MLLMNKYEEIFADEERNNHEIFLRNYLKYKLKEKAMKMQHQKKAEHHMKKAEIHHDKAAKHHEMAKKHMKMVKNEKKERMEK
jgi:hypothetical protein